MHLVPTVIHLIETVSLPRAFLINASDSIANWGTFLISTAFIVIPSFADIYNNIWLRLGSFLNPYFYSRLLGLFYSLFQW